VISRVRLAQPAGPGAFGPAAPPGDHHRRRQVVGVAAPARPAAELDVVEVDDRDRRRGELRGRRGDRQLRAAHQVDAELARLDVGADHAVHAVAIGQRERAHAEPMGLLDQLLGVARALEEREVRLAP